MRFNVLLILLASTFLVSCAMSKAEQKQASYHFQMGRSYLGERNYTKALIEFSEAEKITPDDPVLLNNLAMAYFYKKHYDLAEQRYLKALSFKPDFSEARNNLGVNYLEMQRWDDAILQFKMVLADIFFLDQEGATANLGLAYLGKGDYPQALVTLKSVVSQNPRNPLSRVNLGRVYFAMDKNELAIEEYKKALELSRNYQGAHYYLALAYLKAKDYIAASNSFKETIRISPDSDKGQLAREYLDSMK